MKKTYTCVDLSTTIQSGVSNRFTQLSSCSTQIRSQSLRKAISRLKTENRVTFLGISTISSAKVPKDKSYYDVKQQQQSFRIANPADEPKCSMNNYDQKIESIKRISSLQQYCKSQSALQMAAQKYTIKRQQQDQVGNSPMPTLIDRLNKEIMKKKVNVVKKVMKEEVQKRIPKPKKEINYELDSMFKNYKTYSQFCLGQNNLPRKEKVYNGYFKIYHESQNEKIFLKKAQERKRSISDESEAYKEFIDDVNEVTIQQDVYHSNIRNPFLDDKVTVTQMKKAGFLKRRTTQP